MIWALTVSNWNILIPLIKCLTWDLGSIPTCPCSLIPSGCGADTFEFSRSVQSWTTYVHQSNAWKQGAFRPHLTCYPHYLVPRNGPTGYGRPSFHLLSYGLTWIKYSSIGLSWSQKSAPRLSSCLSWRLLSSDHPQELVHAQPYYIWLTRSSSQVHPS